jgi:hypothetical protein
VPGWAWDLPAKKKKRKGKDGEGPAKVEGAKAPALIKSHKAKVSDADDSRFEEL